MASYAVAGEISAAEAGCYLSGISFCSVCACPLAEVIANLTVQFQQSICFGGIDSARKMHRKLPCSSQEMQIKKNNNGLIFL